MVMVMVMVMVTMADKRLQVPPLAAVVSGPEPRPGEAMARPSRPGRGWALERALANTTLERERNVLVVAPAEDDDEVVVVDTKTTNAARTVPRGATRLIPYRPFERSMAPRSDASSGDATRAREEDARRMDAHRYHHK